MNESIIDTIVKLTILLFILPGISACISPEAGVTRTFSTSQKASTPADLNMEMEQQFAVSTDGFGIPPDLGQSYRGTGSGDLVLSLNDDSGTKKAGLRKRSLLIDLSLRDKKGSVYNDLTYSELLTRKKPFYFSSSLLDDFIKDSKQPKQLKWQVFALANQVSGDIIKGDLKFNNFGIMTTAPIATKEPLDRRGLHHAMAYRSELIMNNNRYGIESNGGLVSFAGEKSAMEPMLHGITSQGSTLGILGNKYSIGVHELQLTKKNGGATTYYKKLGYFELVWDARLSKATLIYKSI